MQKETRLQFPLFTPKTEWTAPFELKDLTDAKEIAIDLETRDPHLKENGPGWPKNTVAPARVVKRRAHKHAP